MSPPNWGLADARPMLGRAQENNNGKIKAHFCVAQAFMPGIYEPFDLPESDWRLAGRDAARKAPIGESRG